MKNLANFQPRFFPVHQESRNHSECVYIYIYLQAIGFLSSFTFHLAPFVEGYDGYEKSINQFEVLLQIQPGA